MISSPLVSLFALAETTDKLYDIRSYGYPKILRSLWDLIPNNEWLSDYFPGERFIFALTVALIALIYRFYPGCLSKKETGYLRFLLGKRN